MSTRANDTEKPAPVMARSAQHSLYVEIGSSDLARFRPGNGKIAKCLLLLPD